MNYLDIDSVDGNLLIVMSGVPGSGKSTLAKIMQDNKDIYTLLEPVIVSPDDIRVELFGSLKDTPRDTETNAKVFSIAHERIKDTLDMGYDVIFDATNLSQKYRKGIYDQYHKMATIIVASIVPEDEDFIYHINETREEDSRIPKEIIQDMIANFDLPESGIDCDHTLFETSLYSGVIQDWYNGKYKELEFAQPVLTLSPDEENLGGEIMHPEITREKDTKVVKNTLKDYANIGSLIQFRDGAQLVVTRFADQKDNIVGVLLDDTTHIKELMTVDITDQLAKDGKSFVRSGDIVGIYGAVNEKDWDQYYSELSDPVAYRPLTWEGNLIPLLKPIEYTILNELTSWIKEGFLKGSADGNVWVDTEMISDSISEISLPFGSLFTDFAHTLKDITIQELLDEYVRVYKK